MQTLRIAAAAVAVTALLAAGAAVARRSADAVGTHRYTAGAGWSFAYGQPFVLESSASGPQGRALFAEVTAANFDQRMAVESGSTPGGGYTKVNPPLTPAGVFPADGVAFRMLSTEGGPLVPPNRPDSRFPLRLATFVPVPFTDGSHPDVPRGRERTIDADGQHYTATIWIGNRATPALRASLARVVASLRFPRLRTGQMGGDFKVLRPAERYPAGSFTLVHAPGSICTGGAENCRPGRQPFYLVHAPGRLSAPLIEPCLPASACTPPGAFYGVSSSWEDRLGGYRSSCRLRFDASRDEFACANLRARWDRLGRAIEVPPGARFAEPLQFTFAKIGWDGHVMLVPGLDEQPPGGRQARLLWPR